MGNNKLIILLSIICFLTNTNVNGQFFGIYKLNDPHNTTDSWNIHLSESSSFLIYNSSQVSDDIMSSFIISSGSFNKKGNKIYLFDQTNNFEMCLKLKGNKLEVMKSFCFLNSKVLTYYQESKKISSNLIDSQFFYRNVIKELEIIRKAPAKAFNITVGKYDSSSGLSLFLTSDQKYQLFYKEYCLSMGIWKEELNFVVLEDEILKSRFFLVKKDSENLISKYLPGDYVGVTFNLVHDSGN